MRFIKWAGLLSVLLLVCAGAAFAQGGQGAPGAAISAATLPASLDEGAPAAFSPADALNADVAPADAPIVYYRYDPLVVSAGSALPVTLLVQGTGSVTGVSADLENGDHVAAVPLGGNAYRLTFTAAQVLYNYATGYNHNYFGGLKVQTGATQWGPLNLSVNVKDSTVPAVAVTSPAADARVGPHVVNLLMPAVAPGVPEVAVAKRFYQLFPDTFDFLNIVSAEAIVDNRYHLVVRNSVQGIGLSIFNNSSQYGSGGRLIGITNYPVSGFFDLAEFGSQHEIGHQWINFVLIGQPHWPISDLARGIMGWSIPGSSVGGEFPWDLIPLGNGNYEVRFHRSAQSDVGFTDLDLYLMGMLPPAQVRSAIVFQNQDQADQIHDGGILQGPVQVVNANTIIASKGARQPSAATARRSFHIGSIIVSRQRLLTNDEMAFFDYMAARGEATTPLKYAIGLVRGVTKPFFLSTHGLGTWTTNLQKSPTLRQTRVFLPIELATAPASSPGAEQ